MKENLILVLTTLLQVLLYILYFPIAAAAVVSGAIALTVKMSFIKMLSTSVYEEEEDSYEKMLIKLFDLLL